jgi:hypothetical protein
MPYAILLVLLVCIAAAPWPAEWSMAGPVAFVFVTGLLVWHSVKLWKSTGALVKEDAATVDRQLQAYVVLKKVFFVPLPNANGPSTALSDQLKISIQNRGETPAYQLKILAACTVTTPPTDFDYPAGETVVGEQTLDPGQEFHPTITQPPIADAHQSAGWFVYGRLIYKDAHERWWEKRFCYTYLGGNAFVPHGAYNQERGPSDRRPK